MKIEYSKIGNLENILTDASLIIGEKSQEYNYILAYEFNINAIKAPISDVTDEAQLWASEVCPKELHFNHGSYIGDGLEHIISELNKKPTSNRALFSLLSQKNISNSEDRPIPSFMIFQTCIDGNTLYCTVYFRALEVSKFLRINIEEIRLKLNSIYTELPNFSKVRLVIFAFRGYNNPLINPLKKAKIDLMSDIQIYKMLDKDPRSFADLIREKALDSTVIYLNSLNALKEALIDVEENHFSLNIKYIKTLVNDALEQGENLKFSRTKHSHHESIDEIKDEFMDTLNKLASQFEKGV